MSVFTPITRSQLEQFFSTYTLGIVLSFEGIKDGIDNTNYWVSTTQGSFVLTLFESLSVEKLPYFLTLLSQLGQHLSCPKPQYDRKEKSLREFNGKPAAIFNCLSGAALESPTILHCHEIGLQLASLHRCTQDTIFPIKNSHDLSWCKLAQHKLKAYLSPADHQLITDELVFQAENSTNKLPQGVIHADLFRDNVLFDGDRVSGLLDFYGACTDSLLLDVAITANDWCCDNGIVNDEKFAALLAAYESLRALETLEKQHWTILLRAAALRFWLSRLEHQNFPRPGEMTQQKDPLLFRRILVQHRQQPIVSSNSTILNLRSSA